MTRRRDYGSGSVYQRGSDGRWIGTLEAGWTAKGTRRRRTIYARTEAEAKRKLRDLALSQRAGQSAGRRTTVKAWCEEWLPRRQTRVRPSTWTAERAAVRWIVSTIGHVRIEDLTPAHVWAVRAAVTREHSTSTALRHHRVLVLMLRDAQRAGHAVPPAALLVDAPVAATTDRQAMSAEHVLAVLREAGARPDGSRWVAALLQGMRQGECLGLTWDQVESDRIVVSWQLQRLPYADKSDRSAGFRLPDGFEARHLTGAWHLVRPKSRAGWRMLPLLPAMRGLLDDWWQAGPDSPYGLVWPRLDGRPRSARDDLAEWHALQAAAGVAHPSGRPYFVHETRHTTSTMLMELGVPESVRVALLGHSSIASTRGYEHVAWEESVRALRGVAGRLGLEA